MNKQRKRRKDAVGYKFKLYGLATCLIKVEKKHYVYETVITREAKRVAGHTQALYSLYRDLHRTTSAKTIFGMRAICFEDFNAENHLCKLEIHQEGLSEDSLVEEF